MAVIRRHGRGVPKRRQTLFFCFSEEMNESRDLDSYKIGFLNGLLTCRTLLQRLVPHPVLARFEGASWIRFHDRREIALLAVTVHKQDGGDQLVAVSLDRAGIKHFSGI